MNSLKPTHTHHHTFSNDKDSVIESIANDLSPRTIGDVKRSIVFLESFRATADDAVKIVSSHLKRSSDICAVKLLKPTHRVAVRAQLLNLKFNRDLTILSSLLSKTVRKKQSLLEKFGTKEYKSKIIQERMKCKGCDAVLNVLRTTGCGCPMCGEEAVLVKQSNQEQVKKITKKINDLKLDMKNLNYAYEKETLKLIKLTDDSDYHWFAVSNRHQYVCGLNPHTHD